MYVSVRCCPIEMHFLKIDYFTFCLFLRQPYHENGWYVLAMYKLYSICVNNIIL